MQKPESISSSARVPGTHAPLCNRLNKRNRVSRYALRTTTKSPTAGDHRRSSSHALSQPSSSHHPSSRSTPYTPYSHAASSYGDRSLSSRGFLSVGLLLLTAVTATTFMWRHGNTPQARRGGVIPRASSVPIGSSSTTQNNLAVTITVLAPLSRPSSLGQPSWGEVLTHMASRIPWNDPDISMDILDSRSTTENALADTVNNQGIVVAIGIQNDEDGLTAVTSWLSSLPTSSSTTTRNKFSFVALDSHPSLLSASTIDGTPLSLQDPAKQQGFAKLVSNVLALLFPSARAAQQRAHTYAMMRELYDRRTSDDLLFSFLVLANEAARPVAAVSNSTKRADAGLDAVTCMISNCGKEMFACFAMDSTCRTALDCMNACAFNDQVCSYRCIASYESPGLEKFSLCIIQKHNCLGLSAEIPSGPNPTPMTTFQGSALTHDTADALFVGWLEGGGRGGGGGPSAIAHPSTSTSTSTSTSNQLYPYSWRIFAGKNPAFDFFPCQYQLFYPGKAKNSFWYQPVFKVITINDGRSVWRQRLYRVRRDVVPGTFTLSVLDNGVTSLEKWTILDCDDALEWCVFYYRGAASAAGMSYTGAVLGSRTGEWPGDAKGVGRIEEALGRAGIKMWELSRVSNDDCGGAPLGFIGPTSFASSGSAVLN